MKNQYYLFDTIGTLGEHSEDTTNSMIVAKQWNKAKEVKNYSYYEWALQDLKLSKVSSILVPGAYPKISNFIYDNSIEVHETFLHKIPSMVLAGIQQRLPAHIDILYYHEATTSLLPELKISYNKGITVSSNSKACQYALKQTDSTAAIITSEICARKSGLKIYKVLRKEINMPWICFVKKENPR